MTFEIISTRRIRKEVRFKRPIDIYNFVKRYAKARQEQFFVITLNGSHNVISIHFITIGLVNKTIVHPREVFYHAIKDNAVSLVLAHNHPSGQLCASEEDEEITRRLIDASKIMGFHVVDHIIFSKNDYFSMRENNLCFEG